MTKLCYRPHGLKVKLHVEWLTDARRTESFSFTVSSEDRLAAVRTTIDSYVQSLTNLTGKRVKCRAEFTGVLTDAFSGRVHRTITVRHRQQTGNDLVDLMDDLDDAWSQYLDLAAKC